MTVYLHRYLNDIFTLEIREGMSLQWVCPTIEGPCPTPRESHSAIAYGSKLVIFGGMNGRRLGDCWMLDTGEQHTHCVGLAPSPLLQKRLTP